MIYKPTILEWNWYVLMLGQALIGTITNNFRMVSLHFTGDQWLVEVVLERSSKEDSDEILEIIDGLAVYIDDIRHEISDHAYQYIASNIVISTAPISTSLDSDARVVFKRKEP